MKPIIILQNCEIEGPGTIIEYLDDRKKTHSTIHTYRDEPLPQISEAEAVINLGCPVSIREMDRHQFLKDLFGFVSEAVRQKVPYLGICFGGQMLAKVYGARVERTNVKEIGTDTVRLTDVGMADPLFSGFEPEVPVFQWHADTFRIPFGAQLLAEGDKCQNQAFRDKTAVALQFHLEAAPTDVSEWCDAYAEELHETGQAKDQILSNYEQRYGSIRDLNFRLLDNFFALSNQP